MIPALIAAVVLVGMVGLLDLILTVGVIRRLREHTALLSDPRGRGGPALVEVGQEIGEFRTDTVNGQPIDRNRLSGETLVGFFTPECKPCKERLPSFVELARAMPGGPDRVLAAVVGGGDQAAELVAALRPVAQVVAERHDGPLGTAFQVRAYPTIIKIAPDDHGRLVVVDNEVRLEPAGAPVA
jgi:thiol-disulfide isomerase/thioredoxin